MRILLCQYTCERDEEHLRELNDSQWMREVRADPRFSVLEVYVEEGRSAAALNGGRMLLPGMERYGDLSLKTYRMFSAAIQLEFDYLIKVDSTLASYEKRRQLKTPEQLALLTPSAAQRAVSEPAFFDVPYAGLVRQRAGRQGFESWAQTKGLSCDFKRVFGSLDSTPEYYVGKLYSARRDFCRFIVAHGERMAYEHQKFLGGSEDLMIGRLFNAWGGQF